MSSDHESPPVSPWNLTKSETLEDCRVFGLERHRMTREGDGRSSDFYVLRSPDWINVVALTPEDDLVLIEQWRHGVRHVTLEIPGGMVDPGESPFDAAKRELSEETGFEAPDWHYLGTVEPNPAIQTNRTHTFLARHAIRVAAPRFDSTEECRLVLRPYREAAGIVVSGEIEHALVICGLHFEGLRRAGYLEPRDPDSVPRPLGDGARKE